MAPSRPATDTQMPTKAHVGVSQSTDQKPAKKHAYPAGLPKPHGCV